MITNYTALPLKDLERIAYMEQNALALAMLEVCESEGIDPDDYERLELELQQTNESFDQLEDDFQALQHERDTLLDKLSNLEDEFQQACDELRELNLEKES